MLIEGKQIVAVGRNLHAGGAAVIDARGRIVMPGFIDTHHHLFETALRSFLADGLLFDGRTRAPRRTTSRRSCCTFAPVYRPQDVYISTLFGSLSQLDAGVTTVLRHLADPPLAGALRRHDRGAARLGAARGLRLLRERRRRAGNQYPDDARRIKRQHFASSDQLLSPCSWAARSTCPATRGAWAIGRELGLPVAAHIVGTFGMRPTFDALAAAGAFGAGQPVHPHDRHVRLRAGRRRATPAPASRWRCRSR